MPEISQYRLTEVVPVGSRSQLIEEKVTHNESSPGSEKFSTWDLFPGQKTELPVINIPIDLPLYRMSNGRTQTMQLEWLSENSTNDDFFKNGQEDIEAQRQQHEFLFSQAQREIEGSTAKIIDVIASQGQTEPLIISKQGIVLNGNRRLAAMRELFAEDSNTYNNFGNIRVAVLPPLSEQEELEFETRLQMQVETRLDYSWTDEAMVIERHREFNRTFDQIKAIMNERRASTVENNLNALNEGRRYLREWLKKPHAYTELADKEQIFKDLPKKLKDKSSEHQDAIRKIQWALINAQQANQLEGRIYAISNCVLPRAPELVSRIVGVDEDSLDTDELDDLDFEISGQDVAFRNFADSVTNDSEGETVRVLVTEHAVSIYDEHTGRQSAETPLKNVLRANAILQGVQVSQAAENTLEQLSAQLEAIAVNTKNLLTKVNERKKA